jgi:hypothetical protein
MRKFAYALAGLIAAAGMTLAGAGAASASTALVHGPNGQTAAVSHVSHVARPMTVVTGPGSTDGTSGYFSTELGQVYTTIEGTFNILPAADNIGVTSSLADPQGAIGTGICNNGNGRAAEIGIIYNGKNAAGTPTWSVVGAIGTLKANGADRCVGNGVLNDGFVLHPLLANLTESPAGVTVLIQEHANGVTFSARNNVTTQSFSQYVATRTCREVKVGRRHHKHWVEECTGYHPFYNEALAGVQQNLTNLGGPASSDLVDFSGVTTNLGYLGASDAAESVTSSGTGNAPWLVGPALTAGIPGGTGPNGEACSNPDGPLTALSTGDFSICAATPTGA